MEWNMEDAIAFARKESWEDGWEGGLEKGRKETARNLLAEGSTPEFVRKITGLDLETIEKIREGRE